MQQCRIRMNLARLQNPTPFHLLLIINIIALLWYVHFIGHAVVVAVLVYLQKEDSEASEVFSDTFSPPHSLPLPLRPTVNKKWAIKLSGLEKTNQVDQLCQCLKDQVCHFISKRSVWCLLTDFSNINLNYILKIKFGILTHRLLCYS